MANRATLQQRLRLNRARLASVPLPPEPSRPSCSWHLHSRTVPKRCDYCPRCRDKQAIVPRTAWLWLHYQLVSYL